MKNFGTYDSDRNTNQPQQDKIKDGVPYKWRLKVLEMYENLDLWAFLTYYGTEWQGYYMFYLGEDMEQDIEENNFTNFYPVSKYNYFKVKEKLDAEEKQGQTYTKDKMKKQIDFYFKYCN